MQSNKKKFFKKLTYSLNYSTFNFAHFRLYDGEKDSPPLVCDVTCAKGVFYVFIVVERKTFTWYKSLLYVFSVKLFENYSLIFYCKNYYAFMSCGWMFQHNWENQGNKKLPPDT